MIREIVKFVELINKENSLYEQIFIFSMKINFAVKVNLYEIVEDIEKFLNKISFFCNKQEFQCAEQAELKFFQTH